MKITLFVSHSGENNDANCGKESSTATHRRSPMKISCSNEEETDSYLGSQEKYFTHQWKLQGKCAGGNVDSPLVQLTWQVSRL